MSRHAAPYSLESEEAAIPSRGRHKARYGDRARHFDSLEVAHTFATRRAARRNRRQRVRLETGLRGLSVWAVRHQAPRLQLVEVLDAAADVGLDPALVFSLNRMEREA